MIKPKKRVFDKENRIDVGLSCFGHSLCISQYDCQYDLIAYFDQKEQI